MLLASKGPGNKIVPIVSQHPAFFKMAITGKEKTLTTVLKTILLFHFQYQ